MNVWLTQILLAALGSLAFGIIYRVRNIHLWVEFLGGGAAWLVYLLVFRISDNIVVGNMAAAAGATVFSVFMARIRRAPVVVFLLPCLIPLVPGRGLYYTMNYAVLADWSSMWKNMIETTGAAVGIALGVVICSVFLGRVVFRK